MRFRSLTLPLLLIPVSIPIWACQSADSSTEAGLPVAETYAGEASPNPTSSNPSAALPVPASEAATLTLAAASGAAPIASGSNQPPAATASAQDSADLLQSEARRQQLLRDKQETLSAEYVQRGQAALERADMPAALKQFSAAMDLMPSNQEARAGVRRVQALMGNGYAQAEDYFEDQVDRERVRRAQARLEVSVAVAESERAMAAGDPAAAIAALRRAELILRSNPLIADDDFDLMIIRGRIDSALEAQAAARQSELEAQRMLAKEAQEEAEAEKRNQREELLGRLYGKANAEFQRENYSMAESLARQILLQDPGNEFAIELRDIAAAARHRSTNESNRRNMHEQWVRTFQELETSAVIQNEILVFDDLKRWEMVKRRKPNTEFRNESNSQADENQVILDRLASVHIQARFGEDGEGAPLEEVATYLQQTTGINFLISTQVSEDLGEDETAVNLNLPNRSVRKVLDLISETSEYIGWKVEGGVVKFVTIEELIGGQVLRFYDVRDLIRPVTDFPGREINVIPSGDIELPEEDFEEREALVVTSDTLDTLIRDNIAPESWDADPNNTSQVTDGGTLVVNQTPEVHQLIEELLDGLREAAGIMVEIEARFLKVEDNFLEDIGIDFRGLGSPGLGSNEFFNDFGDATAQSELGAEIGQDSDLGAFYDLGDNGDVRSRVENLFDSDLGDEDVLTTQGGLSFQWTYLSDLQMEMILRAVSKSERVEIVTSPTILVFNTARANLTILNQIAYIQDYDVEIAQASSIADPIIRVVEDGVILDVRPVVSADRRYIVLEVRPTVAELTRPIPEFTTSLGGGSGITIQLPELQISRVRTSVPMPDGSTVLLGGQKIHEEKNFESGIPILNKIPFLSFIFNRKGNFVTNRKLLILLKATIVIPEEHEPTPAQMGATMLR